MLSFDDQEFRDKFNRDHFVLTHDLADYPQFSLPNLIELAKATAEARPRDLYYDVGDVEIGQRWETIPRGSLPIDERIRQIGTQGAWIVLWRAELHPAYSRLLTTAMSNILEMTGPEIERNIKKREIILLGLP